MANHFSLSALTVRDVSSLSTIPASFFIAYVCTHRARQSSCQNTIIWNYPGPFSRFQKPLGS